MRGNLEFEGKVYEFESQKLGETVWVHFQGKTYWIDSTQTKSQRRSDLTNKKSEILAPMPGKITKVLKNSGDYVDLGESVVVMEAMKMEYTLKAETAGILVDLQVKSGTQVELGFFIAKIMEKSN